MNNHGHPMPPEVPDLPSQPVEPDIPFEMPPDENDPPIQLPPKAGHGEVINAQRH